MSEMSKSGRAGEDLDESKQEPLGATPRKWVKGPSKEGFRDAGRIVKILEEKWGEEAKEGDMGQDMYGILLFQRSNRLEQVFDLARAWSRHRKGGGHCSKAGWGGGVLAWCWCRCVLECGRGVAKQEGAWRGCGVSYVSSRRGAAGVVQVVAIAVVFAAAVVVAEASGEPSLCDCRADVFRSWRQGLLHSRWLWDVRTIVRKWETRQEGADARFALQTLAVVVELGVSGNHPAATVTRSSPLQVMAACGGEGAFLNFLGDAGGVRRRQCVVAGVAEAADRAETAAAGDAGDTADWAELMADGAGEAAGIVGGVRTGEETTEAGEAAAVETTVVETKIAKLAGNTDATVDGACTATTETAGDETTEVAAGGAVLTMAGKAKTEAADDIGTEVVATDADECGAVATELHAMVCERGGEAAAVTIVGEAGTGSGRTEGAGATACMAEMAKGAAGMTGAGVGDVEVMGGEWETFWVLAIREEAGNKVLDAYIIPTTVTVPTRHGHVRNSIVPPIATMRFAGPSQPPNKRFHAASAKASGGKGKRKSPDGDGAVDENLTLFDARLATPWGHTPPTRTA
ncbi:hypothetical protein F5148DRAFT_1146511 [Russula earlei]|uniref:Uncharacterized protein n=1 Tax=Russula earlei TaxID=71964 RepID=A0ACC0UK91_9AGAM|nr:hypothetical protein F5148DRAFT_1146511 [Russula earlei]